MNTRFGWQIAIMGIASTFVFSQAAAASPGAGGDSVMTAQASGPGASDRERVVNEPRGSAAEDSGRYGSPAGHLFYDREIRLRPNTKSVGVWRLETIRFVTADGRDFHWRFDTVRDLDVFPLARIAPKDVAVPAANVYVNGEIPLSP